MGSRSQRGDIIPCPKVGENFFAENEGDGCWLEAAVAAYYISGRAHTAACCQTGE